VIGLTAGWCVFIWFWVGLGKWIGDRLPFWRQKAHTVEKQTAETS
jgi:hypothetical protein